jgi:hypothetical protein
MYYAFPANTSFQSFVHKIKQIPQEYVLLMLTFSGSYASMVTKQRYVQERLHEQIPLLVIDVRQSVQVYHHLEQLFPKLFLMQKLPMHVCIKKIYDEQHNMLELQPIMRNAAILGDHHFSQLRALLEEDVLEKEERVTTS